MYKLINLNKIAPSSRYIQVPCAYS